MDQSNPEDFSERERYLPLSVCLTDRLLDYLTARLPDTAISRNYLCGSARANRLPENGRKDFVWANNLCGPQVFASPP